MALSIVKLLSVALTYTLATRILTLEEPASNRTKQPMRYIVPGDSNIL